VFPSIDALEKMCGSKVSPVPLIYILEYVVLRKLFTALSNISFVRVSSGICTNRSQALLEISLFIMMSKRKV